MEMIFATIIGCLLSFICGAAVVYGRELIFERPSSREQMPEDGEMNEQWVKLLSYDGNGNEE